MNAGVVLVALAATGGMNLQSTLDRIRIEQEVPGVSAVVTRKEEVIFAGASGLADLETGRKMTADTVLYAGSLTKILTAVLTLQLVEKGKLSLDDVVPGIAIAIESSKQNVNIQVAHLLTHASGLDREGNFGYWFNADFPNEEALANYLATADLKSAPGDSVSYSNIAYAALGPVIARASGQSYDDALLDDVFRPLGMDSSGTDVPGNQLSAGYSPVNRVIPNEERPFAGLGRYVGTRRIREYHNAKAMTPAFGAYTSSNDLSRLARMLLGYGGDDILSAEMRSRLLTAEAGVHGLGIRLARYKGRPVARHGGWFAAHRTHLLLDLRSGIAVVVMANSDSASPENIAEALLDHALGDASGSTDD